METILALLGGACGAALVSGAFAILQWKLNRKAQMEDRAVNQKSVDCATRGQEIQDLKKMVQNLVTAERTGFYDRIKYLAKAHIKNGYISIEDYEDLKDMHSVYHSELCGNGFLDSLMDQVDKLEKRI